MAKNLFSLILSSWYPFYLLPEDEDEDLPELPELPELPDLAGLELLEGDELLGL